MFSGFYKILKNSFRGLYGSVDDLHAAAAGFVRRFYDKLAVTRGACHGTPLPAPPNRSASLSGERVRK